MKWMVDESTLAELCQASREDDPFHVFSEDEDGAAEQVNSSLIAETHPHREALADRMGSRRAPFDVRTAELIAHVGIDPLAVAVMQPIAGMYMSIRPAGTGEDDQATVYLEEDGNSVSGFVRLSRSVVWQTGGEVTVTGLPDTLALAADGRRLADVVSHPVLDRHNHIIRSARHETFDGITYVHLELGPPVAMPTARELLDMTIGGTACSIQNPSIAA